MSRSRGASSLSVAHIHQRHAAARRAPVSSVRQMPINRAAIGPDGAWLITRYFWVRVTTPQVLIKPVEHRVEIYPGAAAGADDRGARGDVAGFFARETTW
jgi:hypothetical protein